MKKFLFLLGLLAFFGAKAMEKSHDENGGDQNEKNSKKNEHYWCRRQIDPAQMIPDSTFSRKPTARSNNKPIYVCHVENDRYCDKNGNVYIQQMIPIKGNPLFRRPVFLIEK